MRHLSTRAGRDEGAALLMVLGITAVITALAVTATTLSINNLKNTTRDKQAGSALATSEAGVAEAIEYLRAGTALTSLTCMEPAPGGAHTGSCLDTTMSWTSKANPMQVPVDGTAGTTCQPSQTCYLVWISTVTPYNPPITRTGVYRIRSTGKFGNGPASRSVVVDVQAKPHPFPIGIFAETLDGSGGAGIHRESLFTNACVQGRAKDPDPDHMGADDDGPDANGGGLRFEGDRDLAHDQPPAAHSTAEIVTGNNCNRVNDQVHKSGQPCNTVLPDYYDQSGLGGALNSAAACYRKWVSPYGTGTTYPTTSKFTTADLQDVGYRPRGLSDSIYTALRTRATSAGTYFTNNNANPYSALDALGGGPAVLYYKVPAGQKVVLGPTNFPSAYLRQESDGPSCSGHTLVLVVEGGDLTLNSIGSGNSTPITGLAASIFVPDGAYAGAGGVWVIGTLFANNVKLSGTTDYRLDRCFVQNPPAALMDIRVTQFREDDTHDAP